MGTEYTAAGAQSRCTEYGRDLLIRLQHSDAQEGFIDFHHDAGGRMTTYEDTGGTVRYAYNATDKLVAVAEPGGDCTGQTYTTPGAASTRCILFELDDGRRTAVRYPGGAT